MTVLSKPIPKKLKSDAILEAILEIRFETATIPEVLFGRLADFEPWKGFKQARLPAYDIPETLRQVDENLRHAPVFELTHAGGHKKIRIGGRVLSYHQLAPYVGWAQFKPDLARTIDALFSKGDQVRVTRLGFRYVNALRSDVHGITGVSDLDMRVTVAGELIPSQTNVNFNVALSDDARCTLRIATKEFIAGALPQNTTVVIDVDVFTPEPIKTKITEARAKDWLEFAHDREKEQFFRLLTLDTIQRLQEVG